jgi:hypothetical protein
MLVKIPFKSLRDAMGNGGCEVVTALKYYPFD